MSRKTTAKELPLFPLLDEFIKDCQKGKRLKSNGRKLRNTTVVNYTHFRINLIEFCDHADITPRFRILSGKNKREFQQEQRYWKTFYRKYTDFLYHKKNQYDNYVGHQAKMLRSFFNYIRDERGYAIGNFHRQFHVTHEEVQIVALSPDRLKFLIYDEDFDQQLNKNEKMVKDIFVFGCTVALRVGDLMALRRSDLVRMNGEVYLQKRSTKTQAFTRVKLPDYCLEIVQRYKKKTGRRLLPYRHTDTINKHVKVICEKAGWTEPIPKLRMKRGVPQEMYLNKKTKRSYRFCDLVTSHTMRRTGITTYLALGVREEIVRGISGHAPGSKEFWRYVKYSQMLVDDEMDAVHERLKSF